MVDNLNFWWITLARGWALKNGLVDVKVCAVSEEWSALKLVVPLSLRQ
jgi:hypothetical protein